MAYGTQHSDTALGIDVPECHLLDTLDFSNLYRIRELERRTKGEAGYSVIREIRDMPRLRPVYSGVRQ